MFMYKIMQTVVGVLKHESSLTQPTSGACFTMTLSGGQLHIQGKCRPRNQGQGPKVRGSETTRLRDMETLQTTVPGNKEIKIIRSRLWRTSHTSLKANIKGQSPNLYIPPYPSQSFIPWRTTISYSMIPEKINKTSQSIQVIWHMAKLNIVNFWA